MFFRFHDKIVMSTGMTLTNLFDSYRINPEYQKSEYFHSYVIQSGEQPEDVSSRFYGSTDFWWIILLYAKIRDPFMEWPLNGRELNAVIRKYDQQVNGVRSGNPLEYFAIEDFGKTIRTANDDNRTIKILLPRAAMEVVRDVQIKFGRRGSQI